ncbi:conserved hypothetical protein [Ricinus communis]|uniref:Uncharacterized protein n=1 Tax=Ricinus communis TaxID=3988 RepID=B9RKD8_RICCO|nr:conserved hypothetical protein [Ricinus communis]
MSQKKIGEFLRGGAQMACSLCKAKGHNKKGCPNKAASTSQAYVVVPNSVDSVGKMNVPSKVILVVLNQL